MVLYSSPDADKRSTGVPSGKSGVRRIENPCITSRTAISSSNSSLMKETKHISATDPICNGERYILLDALRGLALFGICLANWGEFDVRIELDE